MIKIYRMLGTLWLATLAGAVQASPGGGGVVFGPGGAGIPTLSGSMLMLLGVMMVVVAFRMMRSNPDVGNRVAGIAVLSGGVVLSGYQIKDTLAGGDVTVTGPGGQCNSGGSGSYDIFSSGPQDFVNNCPNTLTIISNTIAPCGQTQTPGIGMNADPQCLANGQVGSGSRCALLVCVPQGT